MDTENAFLRLSGTLLLLATLCISGEAAAAAIPVTTAKDGQFLPWVVDDGKGGVLLMWEDYRTGKDWDVYAQRVDSTGSVRWQENGIPICTVARNQRRLRMARSAEHAIVVWNDRRHGSSWDIYAQAVNLHGEVLWQKDGIPVCVNTADQSTQAILSDGVGGAVCVWEDERRSSEFQDLYIQRINAEGEPMWQPDGIPVSPSESLQSDPILLADGGSGFYVIWWDVIGYEAWHLMAYRLSWDAEPLWDAPRLISPADGMQGEPRAIPDGAGGFVILWQVYENFINDQLYAQRIDPDGNTLWGEAGVPICTAQGIQKHATIARDGGGGFITVWRDERDVYSDLYMQRLLADGTRVWAKDGIPLCTAGGHQDRPFIVRTESERLSVVWLDYREDFGEDSRDAIYRQQIDLAGTRLWAENGVVITENKGKHYPPFVISLGNGRWGVVWSQTDQDNGDIYLEQF